LILAHWGGGLCFYELLKKEAPDVLRNVYYDTAASPYLYKHSIYSQMSNALAKGKILFGSDYPLLAPRRYFQDMAEAQLTPEEVNDISGGNAARLFG
jgi:predicted TIM-barrel fold metal-dependent hydrolase